MFPTPNNFSLRGFGVEQLVGAAASVLALIALIIGLLAGPTDSGSSMSSKPAGPSSPVVACSSNAVPSQVPTDVQPREDVTDPQHLIVWDSCEVIDDTHIRVHYSSGNPACWGSYARVVELNDYVTITVRGGALPEASRRCTDEARAANMVVTLEKPLGNRKVADPSVMPSTKDPDEMRRRGIHTMPVEPFTPLGDTKQPVDPTR